MKKILKTWWDGTYVDIETDKYGNLPPGAEPIRRHWTAKAARSTSAFWLKNWQWCFTAAFSTAGLIIAAMKL